MRESNTKQLILVEATHLFYERGFAGASIGDIVRAVGVSRAAVYIYFRDKDHMLFEIIEGIGAVVLGKLYPLIEIYDDPLECLRAMILTHVCLVKDKHEELKIYLEEQYQLPGNLQQKALRQQKEIYNLYRKKIIELKENGLISEIDGTVSTFCILAMMNWTYRWYRPDGRLPIEEVAEQIISLFLGGVLEE